MNLSDILVFVSCDNRIPSGIFDVKNPVHLFVLQEFLIKNCDIPYDIIVDNMSALFEAGRFPERQAYNKDGRLVTFPNQTYRDKAIAKGTHFINDPTQRGELDTLYVDIDATSDVDTDIYNTNIDTIPLEKDLETNNYEDVSDMRTKSEKIADAEAIEDIFGTNANGVSGISATLTEYKKGLSTGNHDKNTYSARYQAHEEEGLCMAINYKSFKKIKEDEKNNIVTAINNVLNNEKTILNNYIDTRSIIANKVTTTPTYGDDFRCPEAYRNPYYYIASRLSNCYVNKDLTSEFDKLFNLTDIKDGDINKVFGNYPIKVGVPYSKRNLEFVIKTLYNTNDNIDLSEYLDDNYNKNSNIQYFLLVMPYIIIKKFLDNRKQTNTDTIHTNKENNFNIMVEVWSLNNDKSMSCSITTNNERTYNYETAKKILEECDIANRITETNKLNISSVRNAIKRITESDNALKKFMGDYNIDYAMYTGNYRSPATEAFTEKYGGLRDPKLHKSILDRDYKAAAENISQTTYTTTDTSKTDILVHVAESGTIEPNIKKLSVKKNNAQLLSVTLPEFMRFLKVNALKKELDIDIYSEIYAGFDRLEMYINSIDAKFIEIREDDIQKANDYCNDITSIITNTIKTKTENGITDKIQLIVGSIMKSINSLTTDIFNYICNTNKVFACFIEKNNVGTESEVVVSTMVNTAMTTLNNIFEDKNYLRSILFDICTGNGKFQDGSLAIADHFLILNDNGDPKYVLKGIKEYINAINLNDLHDIFTYSYRGDNTGNTNTNSSYNIIAQLNNLKFNTNEIPDENQKNTVNEEQLLELKFFDYIKELIYKIIYKIVNFIRNPSSSSIDEIKKIIKNSIINSAIRKLANYLKYIKEAIMKKFNSIKSTFNEYINKDITIVDIANCFNVDVTIDIKKLNSLKIKI